MKQVEITYTNVSLKIKIEVSGRCFILQPTFNYQTQIIPCPLERTS